jgi:acetylornithine deacetylase/succinyl-diaminopimelate desuccinylase-like protein
MALTERLLSVYREASGDEKAESFRMGGGTYARYLPNAYSIGTYASYAGTPPILPEGHGQVHGKDEYISIPMFKEGACILAAMLTECDAYLRREGN